MGSIDDSTIALWSKSVREKGFFWVSDKAVGTRVDKIRETGYPFDRKDGLVFCRLSTVGDERVRRVASSVIERPGLGAWKAFGRDPSRGYCTFRNPPSEVRKPVALHVQLWPTNSKVVFHEGSHLHSLDVKPASTGWFEVSLEELKSKGVTPVEVTMKEGGLSISDARLAFTIVEGTAIIFGFGAREEVKQWAKMKLPKSLELEEEVKIMREEAIETGDIFIENFVFE